MTIDPMPDFEGEPVHAGAIKLTGGGTATRSLHIGETVILTIEATVTKVNHVTKKDQLVREHTLDVVGVTEPLDDIVDRLVADLRAADDTANGRTPLPFDGDEANNEPAGE